jgi:hypothetical protein
MLTTVDTYGEEKPMKTDTSKNDTAAAGPRLQSLSSRAPAIAFATAVSACAIYAAANGPTLWSTAQRLKAEQLQQEDLMFCERFRMPHGSESFATCVVNLTEIRRRHGDRLAAEAAGVL